MFIAPQIISASYFAQIAGLISEFASVMTKMTLSTRGTGELKYEVLDLAMHNLQQTQKGVLDLHSDWLPEK